MNRISLSPAERNFRSRLAQLVHDNWLLRGTLSVRSRKCGKATCHCAIQPRINKRTYGSTKREKIRADQFRV
jgi:hypothetical protein